MLAKKQEKNKLEHFYSGFISGVLGSIITQPLDVIKTTILVNPTKNPQIERSGNFKSIVIASKQVWQNQNRGLREFYRGSLSAAVKQAFGFGTYVFLLDRMNNFFDTEHSSWKYGIYLFTSATSKLIAMAITSPLSLIKTRMEIITENPKSYSDIIKEVTMKDGKLGLFKGMNSILYRELVYTVFHYTIYRYLRDEVFSQSSKYPVMSILPAFLAGLIGNTISHPFEVVRNRMQAPTNLLEESKNYINTYDAIKKIYQTEGFKGYFKGLVPRLIRRPLNSGITWMTYELVLKHYFSEL